MPSRSLRRGLAALTLGMLLGACQLTVGVDTTVDASGQGTVTLHMGMDEELLTTAKADLAEMQAFESLFEDLAARGWVVTRVQPDGGLEMRAERAFSSVAEHSKVIGQLQGALARNPSELIGDLKFDLRLRTNKGLFQTRARFDGSIDTASGITLPPHLLSAIEDLVRFEVGVTLPGEAKAGAGASSDGSRIVWHPPLGERSAFAASSEALRLGPTFVGLFAILALTALAISSAVGRRRRATELEALEAAVASSSTVLRLDDHRRPLPDADIVLTAKPIDVEQLLGEDDLRREVDAGRRDRV
jgi:hypothetical protein